MCECKSTKLDKIIKADKLLKAFIETGNPKNTLKLLKLAKRQLSKEEWEENEEVSQFKADLRQVIVDTKDPKWAFEYCKSFGDDIQMRQIILDAGEPKWAAEYCECVENNPELRQLVVNSKDPKSAYHYCRYVSDDADMRQIILDAGNPEWAYWYCANILNDENMRQVILDAGDPEWIRDHCCYFGDDAEMRQAFMEFASFQQLTDYVIRHKKDTQILELLFNNIDKLSLDSIKKLYVFTKSSNKVSDEITSKLKQVIISKNAVTEAYEIFCKTGYDDELAQVIIDSGNPNLIFDMLTHSMY